MLNKAHRTKAYDIWNAFINGGNVADLPPHIRQSWQRCRDANVNPRKDPFLIGIDQETRSKRIEETLDLHQLIDSHNTHIQPYFDSSPIGILFCDNNGTVLAVTGHDKILRQMEDDLQADIVGSCLKESIVGTTAPGICLEEKRFASVYAEEHYVRSLHWSSCIATPIFDAEQNLMGCLDFTVTVRDGEKLQHLIPLLLNTANCLQFELSLKNRLEQLELFHSYYRSTFDYSRSILILVNIHGVVIDFNHAAQEMMQLSPAKIRSRDIGRIFKDRNKISSILNPSGGKIFLKFLDGQRFSMESIPLANRAGLDVAFLLKLEKEKKQSTATAKTDHVARYAFSNIIGMHPRLIQIVDRARKAAHTRSTILLEGETGTGKELFAHAIHQASPFQAGPFVAVNCSAFPRELIESELFGYEKGAYTGALRDGSPGKFELADGGTLFLDEIHTMDKATQMKILRVIEDRQVTRIGGRRAVPLDLRIIAASSENLEDEMTHGNFIAPLYFRLNVVKLKIPSLRQRAADIPLLVDHFIEKMNRRFGRSIQAVETSALDTMVRYDWPGNVRELRNCMERAFIFCSGHTIECDDLFDERPAEAKQKPAAEATLDDMTRKSMIEALEKHGNVKHAALALDIPLTTFYRKMKIYGIRRNTKGCGKK
ncbi:GAF modulated two component system response regulator, sigma54-specific [Desulfosarcina variabilis str. Montpellier]|uniref:sigma-54-dependent Fis family transcriptional regulator n=1 Tax=Desulfosarcina variabilis TaxID=2300 RepID=UPI003AFAF118